MNISTYALLNTTIFSTTSVGFQLKPDDIKECILFISDTVPIHEAENIRHDVKKYLNISHSKFAKKSGIYISNLPLMEEIATPIYIITLIGSDGGNIVYVGKAASSTNRFKNGHAVLLKLLSTAYNNYGKYISFANIIISTYTNGKIPVKWVCNSELRINIIKYIEHCLIWKFQPQLNSQLKDEEPDKDDFDFLINFWGGGNNLFNICNIKIKNKGISILKFKPNISIF